MMSIKRNGRTRNTSGRMINLLENIETFIGEDFLLELVNLYNQGYSPWEIGKEFDRDPDDIFLILFLAVKQGIKIQPRKDLGRRVEC